MTARGLIVLVHKVAPLICKLFRVDLPPLGLLPELPGREVSESEESGFLLYIAREESAGL